MPSLKLSNPFRRGGPRPSLKQRAAALKAKAGRVMRRPQSLPPVDPTTAVDGAPDAELIVLERLLIGAERREAAAWERSDDCEDRVMLRRPARPACLTFTADDHKFLLRRLHEHPAALNGSPVTREDIEWMSRKPLTHQIFRPIRDGERAWRDFPGRIPEIVPWPEAQARADEIVAAWKAWTEATDRVRSEEGADIANELANLATEATIEVLRQISEAPAQGAVGLRVKLRALETCLGEINIDTSARGLLLRSLMKDAGVDLPPVKAEGA